jgi:Rrf2 family protein
MFKMNRKVEYALMALKHMSGKRPGEISTAKEIAESYGCSFDTIARILQNLTQKNWLHSTQGATGGYIIMKDLAKVSFYDLSILILGPINLVRCISSSCQIKRKCNIISPVQTLNDHLIGFYKSLSILSLLEDAPLESFQVYQPQHAITTAHDEKKDSSNRITHSTKKTPSKSPSPFSPGSEL